MNILAFDCSGNSCSAAVLGEDELMGHQFKLMRRGQAEQLVPMIRDTVGEAGLDFPALDLLAVTTGPGSFAGVRIGIAAAHGLSLALDRPVMGLTSFAVVAAMAGTARAEPAALSGHGPDLPLAVALDSRRDELYLQVFSPSGATLGAPGLIAPKDCAAFLPDGPLYLAGDAALRLATLLPDRRFQLLDDCSLPDAAALARLARANWRPGDELTPVEPLYLRAPDTTQAKGTAP